MKKVIKSAIVILTALVLVLAIGAGTRDSKLKASEEDGNTTAVEQQQEAVKESKPVEVVVPEKLAEEVKSEETPVEEETVREEEAIEETEESADEETTEGETVEGETVKDTDETATEGGETSVTENTAEEKASESEEEIEEVEEVEEEEEEEETEDVVPAETETPAVEKKTEKQKITAGVSMRNEGDLFYGDTVVLDADITGDYSKLRWQYNNGGGWQDIAGANGKTYTFTVTEKNAEYSYRVVVTGK